MGNITKTKLRRIDDRRIILVRVFLSFFFNSNKMRLGHIDFYLRLLFIVSVVLLALVTMSTRPRAETANNNNFLLFEANINNDDHNTNNNVGRNKRGNNLPVSVSSLQQQRKRQQQQQQQQDGFAGKMVYISSTSVTYNDSAAIEILARSMRIFCICQTTAPRHTERAIHVKSTWGKRCTKLIFASDEDDPNLPAYRFSQWAGREYVSFKMRAALKWAYDHELNNFDWFLKADDDAFIIMENLRGFLSNYSPDDDHYFGRHFSVAKSVIGESFVSGAAYALSRSALRRLVEEAYPNPENCPQPAPEAHEDVNLGFCLRRLGILPGETRDQLGRHRFLVFSPWVHLMTGSADRNNWIRKYDKFDYVEGDNCCSDTAILMHYVPGGYMLAMEYFLYRLRPIGGGSSDSELIRSLLPAYSNGGVEFLQKSLISRGYQLTPRSDKDRSNTNNEILMSTTTGDKQRATKGGEDYQTTMPLPVM